MTWNNVLSDDHQYSLVQSNHVEAVGMMSADGTTDNSDDECILQPNLNRPQPDWNVILWLGPIHQ